MISIWADITVVDNRFSKKLLGRYGRDEEEPNRFTKFKYLPQFDFLECKTRVTLGLEYESSNGIELIDPILKNLDTDLPPLNVIDTQTVTLGIII